MSVKEKIDKVLKSGATIPPEVIKAAYGIDAVTDEVADREFLEKYGYLPMFNDIETTSPLFIPNLQNVITLLGIEDDDEETTENPRKKVRKFIDDYPTKKKDWDKVIRDDKRLGDRGVDAVKKVWQRAVMDDMAAKIAEDRRKAIEDAPLRVFGHDLVNVPGSYTIASTMMPRSTERLLNGGNVEAKDVLLDLGENGMQMVPGAGWVATGRRIPKVGNLVTRAFAKADKALPANYLGEGLRNIGGMSRNLAGNSVAPFVSELADAMAYDENSGMDSRADFSLGDAVIGSLVNQAADRGIYHMLSPKAATMNGSIGRNTEGVRNFILNLGRSASKLGDDYAATVRAMASTPDVHVPGRLSLDEFNAARRGANLKTSITPEEFADARKQQMILDAIDDGSVFPREIVTSSEKDLDRLARHMVTDDADMLSLEASGAGVKDYINASNKAEQLEAAMKHNIAKDKILGNDMRMQEIDEEIKRLQLSESADDQLKVLELLDEKKNLEKANAELEVQLRETREKMLDDSKNYGSADAVGALEDVGTYIDPNRTLSAEELKKAFSEHPAEIVNYSVWHGRGPGAATKLDKFGNIVNQALPALAVNKAGKNDWAKQLISEAMKKDSEETHNAPKQRRAVAELTNSLAAEGLTQEDKDFLKAIADKPSRVTTGFRSESDPDGSKFRIWMLARGNDLLREYAPSAYRPSFGIE